MAGILKHFSHRLKVVGAAALLTMGTFAIAQEFRGDHPDTYTVKRGDTLWDIAGKFLKRPWLWPEIWQANPQIKNPHLIYPGDVISLAYLDRVGVTPGPRTEAPVNAVSLSDIEPYLKDLRVVQSFEELPYVVGMEEDRIRVVTGRLAYVKGLEGAQVGQRFAVLRPTLSYHRMTERTCCDMLSKRDLTFRGRTIRGFGTGWSEASGADSGEWLGYELLKVNAGNLMKLPEGEVEAATIALDDPNAEVRVGDRIVPIEAQPYDLQFFPHAPKQALDYDRVRVLAIANSLTSGGPRDVVSISAGRNEGIDNGTVLSIWRQGSNVSDQVEKSDWRGDETISRGDKVRLPDEYIGHVMVFRTFDNVSYGLVMDSVKATEVGYRLDHPDKR
jgi:LysM domain